MARKQARRTMGIQTPLGEDVLLLKGFTASEELGRLFEIQADLLSENHAIGFDDIVGQKVTLRLDAGAEGPRYFNGIVSSFGQREPIGPLAQYEATVVPWLWLLTLTSNCRIFQHTTVPEMILDVLRGHQLADVDNRLSADYRQWEYCVQYRETDFAFLSRLMEQEGIYYYFTHESDKHLLVLADEETDHQAYPGYEKIAFRPPSEATTDEERIRDWRPGMRVRPGAYATTDFDFKNPKKALNTTAKVELPHANAEFEVYDYPGEYVETAEGEQYSRLRLEELQAPHELAWGSTDARGVCVGSTFELIDFPRADQCKSYLITASKLTALSDDFASRVPKKRRGPMFSCTFTCMDVRRPFRTEQTTPKPIVQGPQTAIVVGPKGEEIHTDPHGRVKVQFHWDRYGAADENSSCWIRVAQTWAGKHWGAICLPRIGHEVIVDFLEGDPDRPIITGRVYNGLAQPPYELPDEKTKSTVKSNSTKGGEGFNELRFEDKKDKEQVFLHAQRNLDIRAKNDAFVTVERDRHLVVQQNDHERVEYSRNEIIGGDHKESIGGNHELAVDGDQRIRIEGALGIQVTGTVDENFAAGHTEFNLGSYALVGTNVTITGLASIKLAVGGSVLEVNAGGVFATPPIQPGRLPVHPA